MKAILLFSFLLTMAFMPVKAQNSRVWATYYGGALYDVGNCVATDASGNVYLAGYTNSTSGIASGGFQNAYGGGTYDAFLVKFTSPFCSVTGTDVQTACNSFTWIDGITYTSSNNTATYNIAGGASNGCDSLVTLNLTINTVSDIGTTTSGITITANNAMAGYQWLDCNNGFAVIPGAISQSFTPSANGSFAVELTQNGCTDTSACVNITSVGMIENTFNGQFTLYPNPTNGPLSIVSGNEFGNTRVTIRNVLGQEVYRKNYTPANRFDLTLDGAAGVYSVEIVDGEKRLILKVIKK